MKHKMRKRGIACLLTAVMMLTYPIQAFAGEISGFGSALRGLFASENSSAFSRLEIRKGTLNGELVVDLLSAGTGWKLSSGQDYYLYGEVKKPADADSLQLSVGNEDGTFNGLTFFNPPGGSYKPGTITHDYFDRLTSYSEIADPAYGPGSGKLILQDGTMTYHIKDQIGTNDIITFATGLVVNDAAFNGDARLVGALKVSVGHMAGDSFVSDASKTSDINMASKAGFRAYFSSTNITATLDNPGGTITFYIGDANVNNQASLVYDKLEWDIFYPLNAVLSNIGFDTATASVKTNGNYGTITYTDPVIENGLQKVHITISNGYKIKGSNLPVYMQFTFPGKFFESGQQYKIDCKNTAFIPKGSQTSIGVTDVSAPAAYTILDASTDYTAITALNRPEVYNHTIDGSTSYLNQMGGAQIVNKSNAQPTPREKTYEADFNTTRTAANITAITVPVGDSTAPVVTWNGLDAGGNQKSGTLSNPADYANTKDLTSAKFLFLKASDLGIVTFTGVKADIGRLKPNFSTSNSSPSSWHISNNSSGAFGHFTTSETGIQVRNTFRIYNTDPAYRNALGGDLTVTSTATSTASSRVAANSGGVTIKNEAGASTDSIAAGGAVTISGYIDVYSIPPAAKKGVITATDATLADPVVYLTLPAGLTYETLNFSTTKMDFRSTSAAAVPLSPQAENVSYLNTTGDGVSIYKITFPKGTTLGYYSDDAGRNILNYTVKLRTSKSMETRRYEINSLIGITAAAQPEAMPYSSNPATLNTVMTDKYGINGGRDYLGVTKGASATQPGFGLQQLAEINIYNAISITKVNGQLVNTPWQTYDSSDPNSVASLGRSGEGQFKLNIQNTSDNASKDLKIMIPIPKKGLNLGAAFMTEASQFDMTMDIPSAVLTAAGFTGSYVKVSGTYTDCSDAVNYTASDAAGANAILLTAASIPAKANYEFYFNFKVAGGVAGNTNIWRNVFQYTTSDDATNYKNGSYVASAVAGSSITGTVFEDRNRNGLRDSGEPGVSGVTVVVKDDQNKILSAVTDASGTYAFRAVRDTQLDMQFTASESSKLRFNLPASESSEGSAVTPSANGLSAEKNLTADNALVTVNAALSGYHVMKYDKNNAAASGDLPVDGEYVTGSLANISVKPDSLLLKGYRFKEWNTSADGSGTGYQPGQTMTMEKDVTLYAIWEIGTYTIRFDYRGATGGIGITEKVMTHNQPYNTGGSLPEPVRTGYTFGGWSATSAGTTAISNTAKFTLGDDITLYALWKARTGYPVVYNTGDGGSAIPVASVSWTDPVMPKNEPARPGYEFEGWEYKGMAVGSAAIFSDLAESDTAGSSVTLTARWKAKGGYTVSYDTNGGDAIASRNGVLWSDDSLLPETTPSKSGFAFGGWILSGSEAEVTNASTYGALAGSENTTEITFKAVWNVIANNTVHYATGGGSVYPDKTNVQSTDTNLIPATDPVRPGYEFMGWMKDTTTVTGDTVYSDLNNTANSSVTLTANWRAKSYTIQFSEGGFPDEIRSWNDSGLTTGKTPVRAGSTFDAWYYNGAKVADASKVSQLIPLDNQSIVILEARFAEESYTIVYDSHGGEAYTPKAAVKYSAAGLLPDKSPVRTGYTFTGWYCGDVQVTSATVCGSLVSFAAGQIMTLDARWTEKTGYTVNYNSAGGTAVQPKTGVGWNGTGLLPDSAPVRTGYTFKGWLSGRTTVSNTTAYGSLAGSDAAGSSLTLVAQWDVAGGYRVSFDTGMGKDVADRTNIAWNTQNLIPLQNVAPAGYVVKYWLCGSTVVTPSMTYGELDTLSGGAPVVLTAVYEPVTGNDGSGMDVQGKVIEGGESAIYKIDLSWGPMRFEYSSANIWNPDTHSYVQKLQGWANEPFNGVNNKITAVNHSNADVSVDFRAVVEDPDAMEGVTMELRQQNRVDADQAVNMLLSRVPQENAQAPEISTYLWMEGTPQNSSILNKNDYSKFGTINVTIRSTGSALTPRNAAP